MGQDFAKNYLVMLSVIYAGKTEYSAGITDALLRVDTSRANTCYVLVQCALWIMITPKERNKLL